MKTITGSAARAFQNLYITDPGSGREQIILCADRHDATCEGFHYHASESQALRCYMLHRPDRPHARLLLWRCNGELLVRFGSTWADLGGDLYQAPRAFRRLLDLERALDFDPSPLGRCA